jgi:hypothetical protein
LSLCQLIKCTIRLLKNEDTPYNIIKFYDISPAEFKITSAANRLLMHCTTELINGYGYLLKKESVLQDTGFIINYGLENTGENTIETDEYVHNFTAINKTPIGPNYIIKFPFQLQSALFEETVNPDQKVTIGDTDITFKAKSNVSFFFSNLLGDETAAAQWALRDLKYNIWLTETGSFKTNKVNVWGAPHVI